MASWARTIRWRPRSCGKSIAQVLYMAVLLHDIAKGRGGDHSVLGAEVALKLCPRLGLTAAETETVAWLVRWHLLMSATAFKRDLADFKTILDFAEQVQSPERLRAAGSDGGRYPRGRAGRVEQLEAAIAVGPVRTGGGSAAAWPQAAGRAERVDRDEAGALQTLAGVIAKFTPSRRADARFIYWIAEADDVLAMNPAHSTRRAMRQLSVEAQVYPARGATLITILMTDHPGLFYRMAGAIHLSGGSIIDARIHTTEGPGARQFPGPGPARPSVRRSGPA